ncbi:murein hydrolase transporter LrgA [Paramagnetospirillum marisnigri]|uniref:Murein hydrolase transporter LrgA n=1 Tax=Paramagnetospirillum marisnigri TaxID=1285242 RepID=A0A178M6F3_9PROT|nr:CidA/LrgA family protein [Paramagnetospirillum marisnigri]OAN42964.1 murein hydrolase transporter LrgA [Paramagnetospirillum marisnigri]
MLFSLSILLVCQLAGEVLVRLSGLPLPGPVVGMVILFVGLVIRGRVPDSLDQSVRAIFANFIVLFIPASVGVMVHLGAIWTEALPIALGVAGSMVVTLVVAGRLMQALSGGKP